MSKVRVFILVVVTVVIFGLGMIVFNNPSEDNNIEISGDISGETSGEVILK